MRVVTAFPVTVGTQLAIPAGTYVEGVIDKIKKHGRVGQADLQMHFTRMIFSNGYEVALTSATAEANAEGTNERFPGASPPIGRVAMGNALLPQQAPGPAPSPQIGPSKGEVIGVTVGVAVAITVVGVLLARHRGGETVYDTGTQFDLIFQAPISVDGDRVSEAVGGTSAE